MARCAVRAACGGATPPPADSRAGTSQRDVPTKVGFMGTFTGAIHGREHILPPLSVKAERPESLSVKLITSFRGGPCHNLNGAQLGRRALPGTHIKAGMPRCGISARQRSVAVLRRVDVQRAERTRRAVPQSFLRRCARRGQRSALSLPTTKAMVRSCASGRMITGQVVEVDREKLQCWQPQPSPQE